MEINYTNVMFKFPVAIWKLYYYSRRGKQERKPEELDLFLHVNKSPGWHKGKRTKVFPNNMGKTRKRFIQTDGSGSRSSMMQVWPETNEITFQFSY